MGFFGFGKKNKEKEQEKMKTGLEKTRTGFWGNILNTLTGSVIDDDMYDELEEQLILADVGGEVAVRLVDKLRDRVHEKGLKTGEEAADALRDIIAEEMTPDAEMDLSGKPAVILVIGVNGVGKTTSIAKLADHYTREGKKVMLAAGDTFRAAASEQLEIWADRAGVPIVSAGEGADPAAVIFDTVKSATARGYDMVIADTAGRLHNKANLMAELSKISRSVKKASPEASLETLLVLDAITSRSPNRLVRLSTWTFTSRVSLPSSIVLPPLHGLVHDTRNLFPQRQKFGRHVVAGTGHINDVFLLDGGRAIGDHNDPVGQIQCLFDVVGHKNNGAPVSLPDSVQLLLHQVAGLGIQCTEGFVHQQHLGLNAVGTGNTHPLLHATGKLDGEGILKSVEPH